MKDVSRLYIRQNTTIESVMKRIDLGAHGIALLVDDEDRFVTTVTDGDVRRALLAGATVDSPITSAIKESSGEQRRSITAEAGTSEDEQRRLMRERSIRHLPLLDESGHVVALASLEELTDNGQQAPVQAVIMAGGFGTRLRPLTDNLPKPMLPIGGQPLLERTIRGLRQAGIQRINIATHYMSDKITSYFGTGRELGVDLNYVSEDEPLGTAGALSLLGDSDEPLLVMNGDILTQVDFREFINFHRENKVELSVGVRHYEADVPYGVVESEGWKVLQLREKPKIGFMVNAGVYLLEPSATRCIPTGERFDMTDLINRLLAHDRRVGCFPIFEYWIDIGQHDDFQQAQRDATQLRWAA